MKKLGSRLWPRRSCCSCGDDTRLPHLVQVQRPTGFHRLCESSATHYSVRPIILMMMMMMSGRGGFVLVTAAVAAAALVALVAAEAALHHTMPLIPHHVQKARRLKEIREHQQQQPPNRRLQIEDDFFETSTTQQQYRRRQEASQVGALYHGYGTHYADVWVGTPPQRQTVIVDTGSSLTAFPCSGCDDCGAPKYHVDTYFAFEESTTFGRTGCGDCQRGRCQAASMASEEDQCQIAMSYQEGSSWYAFEAKDITYVGGPHLEALTKDSEKGTEDDIDPRRAKHFAFPMTFGCQYKLTGLFKTQLADGIMGMDISKTSFWKQLYDTGKMGEEQKFSLCFQGASKASRNGTEAGAMTFGGVERRLHKTEMVYTANKGKGRTDFFGVKVRKMYLRHGDAGESAQSTNRKAKIINLGLDESVYNSGGVIVDSGTTDTYFAKGIATAFRAAFVELSGTTYDNEVGKIMTEAEVRAYPTIVIQLQGDEELNKAIDTNPNKVAGLAGDLDPMHPYDVIVVMPPSHYMERDRTGRYTPRFYTTETRGSVLGGNFMMGHDVMFDADRRNIGWAESDCDYNKLLTDGGFVDELVKDLPPDVEDPGSQSPADAMNKGSYGWWAVSECKTLTCQGGVVLSLLVALAFGICCARVYCGRPQPTGMSYTKAVLELPDASFRDAGAYVDDPDDAEYGEVEPDDK